MAFYVLSIRPECTAVGCIEAAIGTRLWCYRHPKACNRRGLLLATQSLTPDSCLLHLHSWDISRFYLQPNMGKGGKGPHCVKWLGRRADDKAASCWEHRLCHDLEDSRSQSTFDGQHPVCPGNRTTSSTTYLGRSGRHGPDGLPRL